MQRPIIPINDPLLRTVSAPIDLSAGVPEEIVTLARDMLDTARGAEGAGLAAVQVGEAVRLFIVDLSSIDGPTMAFLNPEITWRSDETVSRKEGCLSMPNVFYEVERPAEVAIRYHDLSGQPQQYKASGKIAMCIQHEFDHLEGICAVDRLSTLRRAMAFKQFNKQKARRSRPRR